MDKNLCVMPWVHTATISDGTVKLCCVAHADSNLNLNEQTITEAWNSNYYQQQRQAFLNSAKPKSCDHCWREEDAGLKSHRQISNELFEKHLGAEYLEELCSSIEVTQPPLTIDFRLGNTCNLQCVMCQPSDSSKWVKPAKQLAEVLESEIKWEWKHKSNIDVSKFDWYKQEQFWKDFDQISAGIKHITFGGGEPLLIKEHKALITRLVENGHANEMKLLYHTNCTIYDQEIVDLWSHFDEVKLMLSIDGVGEVNDYIRRPSKWNEVEANLHRYDRTGDNIVVAINTTVQINNVAHLPEFAQWMFSQNFNKVGKATDGGIFFASVLHWPKYLSIQVLPPEIKQSVTIDIVEFVRRYKNNPGVRRLMSVVDFMNARDESFLWDKAKEYFAKLDSLNAN
jgi:MoaA/NifB/PqqE/SkfB family radical SAM enzyme